MVRCFVGLMVPEDLKTYVVGIQSKLEKIEMDCKFVESENLHLNFSFLGEVEDEKIGDVVKAMDSIDSSVFGVEVGNIKLIPNENYFRVIVLDVFDSEEKLSLLMKRIVDKVGGDSRPPHLTLCRVKNVAEKSSVVRKIKEIRIERKKLVVDRTQLIKSELSRNGPKYSVLHEKKFFS